MSKLVNSILIGVSIMIIGGALIWNFSTVNAQLEINTIQSKDINYLDSKISQKDSLNKDKFIALNIRQNLENDENRTEHKEIKKDVSEIKGMLRVLLRNNDLASE